MTSTYFWPGVAAIWGALFSGAASAATYWRADRGRPELLPLARSLYAAYATCIVAASAVLMTLILQHRFDVHARAERAKALAQWTLGAGDPAPEGNRITGDDHAEGDFLSVHEQPSR